MRVIVSFGHVEHFFSLQKLITRFSQFAVKYIVLLDDCYICE